MRSTALVDAGRFAAAAAELQPSTTPRTESSGARVAGAGVDHLSIGTPALRRSVDFYSRIFGFAVVETARRDANRSVLMAAGRFCLAIHEWRRGESEPAHALRWGFVVDDLDDVRASVWNLGIVPTRDCVHEPRPDRPWRRCRSFAIRDPGGNEIEVVERRPR